MAIEDHDLQPVIETIYRAGLDASQWTVALAQMKRLFDSPNAVLFLHDFADHSTDVSLGFVDGIDASAWDAFTTYYGNVNVWTRAEDRLPSGVAVTSSMLYPDRLLPKTEWYADWLRVNDMFYALGGIADRQGSVGLKVSFLRPQGAGEYDSTAVRLWQKLLPHVQRAADVHRKLAQARQRATNAESVLSALTSGVIQLSAGLRVLQLNAAAERLLGQQKGLRVERDGRLRASTADWDRLLQRELLLAAQPARRPGADAACGRTLALRGSGGALYLSFATLPTAQHDEGVAAAAVFLKDAQSKRPGLVERLQLHYGMTPAEARLTSALVEGRSLQEHADDRGVTVHTVRSQHKAAAAKAGAKRQADLVRVVLTGPAFWIEP